MPHWDPDAYDAWYETPLGSASDRLERELVFSLLNLKAGERALDAGCGTGIYSAELARRGGRVVALDGSPMMIRAARARAERAGMEAAFVRADALRIPFPDGSFDAVVSVCLLCFVRQSREALLEMRRVLKPGGRVVLGLLNSASPWALIRRVKGLVKESVYREAEFISPSGIESLLRGAGFKEVRVESCLFFLPVNSAAYMRLSGAHERLGRALFPRRGAFLAAVAIKT